MAAFPQRTDGEGQVLLFATNVPVLGVVGLVSFTSDETTTGQAGFRRFFRLRQGLGLGWSAWRELTDATLQALTLTGPTALWLQFRYTQVGAGTATLNQLTVQGNYELPTPEAVPAASPLAAIDAGVEDVAQTALEAALLRRLFAEGILPRFIERPELDAQGALADPAAAEGFVAVLGAATAVLARVLRYARQLPRYQHDPQLLRAWLEGHGLLFTPESIGLREGRVLARQLARRFAQRGTLAVAEPGNGKNVAGELRLLLDYQAGDEFFLAPVPAQASGWCLGYSSPGYHTTENQPGLHRSYGTDGGPYDVRQYPIRANTFYVGANESLAAAPSFFTDTGAGPTPGLPRWLSSLATPRIGVPVRLGRAGDGGPGYLPVTSDCDYELSCWVRQQESTFSWLRLGIDVVTAEGEELLATRITTGEVDDLCIERVQLPAGCWYFVRVLLFNQGRGLASQPEAARTNLGVGHNLRLPRGAAGIYPRIELHTDLEGDPNPGLNPQHFDVTGLRLRPLGEGQTVRPQFNADGAPVKGTAGLSWLGGGGGLVQLWTVNRGRYAEEALRERITRYLLPAGSSLLHQVLGQEAGEQMTAFDPAHFDYNDFR